jgi:YegS/Rv2252/BmrU family lipid kinase
LPGNEILYQFCQDKDDGTAKAKMAVRDGVDVVLVAGGDGTINTIGRALIGTEVSIGVIPAGSGNGFARHFEIPFGPDKAVKALAGASVKRIDVGVVNGVPFLVTCSMAWDASIVRSFEKSFFRGVFPYLFAGVNEFLKYKPQEMTVELDSGERLFLPDPIVFTIANLTQYGGGAIIAPHARPDDKHLELVVALNKDVPNLITKLPRLYDGSAHKIRELITRRFQRLKVSRKHSADIQVDGELIKAGESIEVFVMPASLKVLAPAIK